ncbi:aspartate/glutamate racemase family protein [Hahella ganghwensis]|uniref:aspartate/glutamate racemase family protein n=1 Tax=Hahella ganghwensis TaxID=286420 RepID=UPI00037B8897|nr:aspartate/glutamate racemase family protein [Hahella ganghwensis]
MRTLGILGGMSWESTASYYQRINTGVRERLAGLHSASLLIASYDFAEIEPLQAAQDWTTLGHTLSTTGSKLEQSGAEGLLIATNTMHRVAEEVESTTNIPLIHIADATASLLRQNGVQRIALLGTVFTMQMGFYKNRLQEKAGVEVLVPKKDQQAEINRVIYEELCQGVIRDESRAAYLQIASDLQKQGAEGVILGCTEIGLLLKPEHTELPLFDTTEIHCEEAVSWMLAQD